MANTDPQPWEVGDQDQRWDGYFTPGTHTLRNHLGIADPDELSHAEHDLTQFASITMMADPAWRPQNYGLTGFSDVHRALFQDIYPWAGQLRTIKMRKGNSVFLPPDGIADTLNGVDEFVREHNYFRAVPDDKFPTAMATVWMVMNAAHPFREGNGRTTRIMLSAMAAESERRLDWTLVPDVVNNLVAEQAMETMNNAPMAGLIAMIAHHVDDAPPTRLLRQDSSFGTEANYDALVDAFFATLDRIDPQEAARRRSNPTVHDGDAPGLYGHDVDAVLARIRELYDRAESGELSPVEGIEAARIAAYAPATGDPVQDAETRDLAEAVDETSTDAQRQDAVMRDEHDPTRPSGPDDPAPDDTHLDGQDPRLR